MALTDSLRILITANGAQAEREFSKVGAAARTNLGHAESSSQRLGRSLTSAGVAMVAFGGVALVGLYKAAQAAQEEDLAIAKLNNSIANSPELAGASADAFLEQAAALQDVTTFTDDATIAAQAMLGTFHLTQSEILGLTPLVQDLASKFDMDLNRASILVGKAMDGNAGALGRMGVRIDETAFAADRYSAVMTALRENAGGFAEQEGATFNGQMTIMKNNLGDIAEGVGRGAVEAFNSMLGPVKSLSDEFQQMSPEAQATIGKFATFGATGLVVAGSMSFVAGQVLTAVERLKELRAAAISSRGAMLGLAGGIAGMTAAAALWAHAQDNLEAEFDIAELLSATDSQLEYSAAQFQAIAEATNEGGDALAAFTTLAETNIEAATRFGAAWASAGGPASDIYMILNDAGGAARRAALGLDDSATSAEELAATYDHLSESIDNYLNRVQGQEEAAAAEAEAQQALADALVQNGHTFDINTAAGRENIAARNSWMDAVAGQIQAAADFAAQTGRTGEAQGRMNAAMRNAVGDLQRARDAGLITEEQFRALSRQIRNIPRNVNINTDLQGEETVISGLNAIYDAAVRAGNAVGQTGGSLAGGGSYTPQRTAPRSAPRGGPNESAMVPTADEIGRSVARHLQGKPLMTVGVG